MVTIDRLGTWNDVFGAAVPEVAMSISSRSGVA